MSDAIQYLRQRVVDLERELAEARRDEERLDWLESTTLKYDAELGLKCGWYVDESGAPIVCGELQRHWSRTLRAAIDAVMKPI
jgi:hypothetical protein